MGKGGEANILDGGAGDDTFIGEGIDTVIGGAGNDVFFGGQGSALNINLATSSIETVWGSFVGDIMDGSTATANLTMVGQGLTGGANADTMMGGSGNDFIYYRAGDVISGGAGSDWAVATLSVSGVTMNMTTTGFENAWGSTSDDTITAAGASTAMVMVGDTGNDTLTGGNVGDFLYGFGGNDILNGGPGNDNLIGGTGTDAFVFGAGWGIDTVWDWQNGTEKFNLAGSGATQFSDLAVTTVGANAVVSFAGNQIWVINGAGQIDATDFLFDNSTNIVITEIMADPSKVADAVGEWFEIANAGTSAVDLNGWTVHVGSSIFVVNNGGPLLIQPGAFLVFEANGDPAVNGGLPPGGLCVGRARSQ